jgi:hypothetical protein
MKIWKIAFIAAALLIAACSKGGSSSSSVFKGDVNVGLTDNVPADGTYVLQDIYNPNVKQIIGVVTVQNAKVGMQVRSEWYQMGLIQFKTTAASAAEGKLVDGATYKLLDKDVNPDSKSGQSRMTLSPKGPLPEDSYLLKVFVDGKLAKVIPFVVSTIVPAAGQQTAPAPAPAPVRTATPPAVTPVATSTPTR